MRLLKTKLIPPAHPRRRVAPFLKQGRRATKARGVLYHRRREGLRNRERCLGNGASRRAGVGWV